MKRWEELPKEMQCNEVRYYYEILRKRRFSLVLKRIFDIVVSLIMIVFFSWLFLILALAIKIDSPGPVFYRQERITRYGKKFKIHKFRTMVINADREGSLVTLKDDNRITRVGRILRKCRLDEISQLVDVFMGNMSFVGTRPEVEKYVNSYSSNMLATLLLPAGITSEASILYKDEDSFLNNLEDVDRVYIEKILPEKMNYNLKSIENFNFYNEIKTMGKTTLIIFGKKNPTKKKSENESAKCINRMEN
ncbi:sugar transferase [Enterococcus mundtii]|uniref:Glycosyl transferase n=1 Tax=Enterococcus mundtii TaxID=53346 RepID=A0A2S7RP66_ENTMU|nr:sugar transferase [Enterococcus mundtii]PQF21033.1 glycosyl transferase [Enterococcus mundtii]